VWVALVRMLLERFLSLGQTHDGRSPALWFAHIVAFYVALHVTLGAVLVKVAKIDWKKASALVGMGLVLGTLPPLIDVAISGRGHFSYEYVPGFIPWSLHRPPRVLPWGETIVLWATIALMTVAVLRATRSILRAVLGALVSYACVLVFLVGLPAASQWLSRDSGVAPSEWRGMLFGAITLCSLIVSLGLTRRALERIPQILLPPLFGLLGAGLKGPLTPAVWLVVAFLAFFGAAFALSNDWYDRREDAAQGRATPLDGDGAQWLSVLPLVFALHVLVLRVEAGLCLIGFSIVAHAYHADPLRLKCVFPLSYKTEGLLGGLALVAGLTAAPEIQPATWQLWAALAVAIGTPAALVFKDAKDVDADASAGVKTAFVFAETHGWPRRRTELISAALLLISLGVVTAMLHSLRALQPMLTSMLGLLALTAGVLAAFGGSPKRRVYAALLTAEAHLGFSAWVLATQ